MFPNIRPPWSASHSGRVSARPVFYDTGAVRWRDLPVMRAFVFVLAPLAPAVAAEGVELEVGFSPDSSAERLVVRAIEHAQQEILVAAYSFTNKNIAKGAG